MELYFSNDIKPQPTDMHDMETQPSPSLVTMKQNNLKIIIDNSTDDRIESPTSLNFKDPIANIAKMVEKIKGLARKKKVSGNLWEYSTCHSCRALLENKLVVHCVEEECSRYFCLRCMNKKYNTSYEDINNIIQLGKWTCFSCRGICNCKICKDRFLEKGNLFYPNQLLRFEKSKRRLPKSSNTPKQNSKESSEQLKRQEPLLSIKEAPQVLESKSSETDIKGETLYEPQEIEIITVIKEQPKVVPQLEGFTKVVNDDKSKLRHKIIAKKKMRENKTFLEPSSPGEEVSEEKKVVELEKFIEDPINEVNMKKGQKGIKKKSKEDCHLCFRVIPGVLLASCSVDKCKKSFCEICIQENFQKDFSSKNYNAECWICYSCGGVCKCNKCSRRRPPGFKVEGDDLLQRREAKKIQNKIVVVKRRPKYYDPITEDEFDFHISNEPVYKHKLEKDGNDIDEKEEIKEIMKGEETEDTSLSLGKVLYKKRRLNGPVVLSKERIDNSKIISEIDIDSACITIYSAENEEELKKGL